VDRSALTILGWQHPLHSSRVGIVDTSGIAVDIAGSASHGVRSTDHIVANTPSIAATANTADIADTEHPNMDCSSKDYMPAPEGRGCSKQEKPAVSPPRKTFSSDYSPHGVRRNNLKKATICRQAKEEPSSIIFWSKEACCPKQLQRLPETRNDHSFFLLPCID
jgi:hypothetical protein